MMCLQLQSTPSQPSNPLSKKNSWQPNTCGKNDQIKKKKKRPSHVASKTLTCINNAIPQQMFNESHYFPRGKRPNVKLSEKSDVPPKYPTPTESRVAPFWTLSGGTRVSSPHRISTPPQPQPPLAALSAAALKGGVLKRNVAQKNIEMPGDSK